METLEDRTVPSTVLYTDSFIWQDANNQDQATVDVTVTEDAPGYEGHYLWNYHLTNTNYMNGAADISKFVVNVNAPDGLGNLSSSIGWIGAVATADGLPYQVTWSAGLNGSLLGIGESADFSFTTDPTAIGLTSGNASDKTGLGQAGGPVAAPLPSLVVDTNQDVVNPSDGLTSLREAINYANDPNNGLPGGQWRIKFKDTLAGATITVDPTKGQLDLAYNVFIDGENRNITIQRDVGTTTKHRIFEVWAGTNARLKGLTLRNGELSNALARGGAVESNGKLTIDNCTFAQNKSVNSDGGAVAAMGGSLTVTGSTFTGNSASHGGAIYVNVMVPTTLSSCSVVLNTATDQGGGIYIHDATVTLSGTDVNGNSAVNAGGGIYVSNQGAGGTTTLTLTGGTTVQNNLVTSASGQGGGIYFGKGTINLIGVWIGSNTATQGDGMYRVNGTTESIGNPGVTWYDDQEFVGP